MIFKFIKGIFNFIASIILGFVNIIFRTVKFVLVCFYTISDKLVHRMVIFGGGVINNLHSESGNQRLIRFFKVILVFILFLIIIFIVAFTLSQCIFTVPVGSSAVVTRLGAYNREEEPGLNLRLPLVEKYYIVNTGNIMEDTFGFVQVGRPISDAELSPQERAIQEEYEAELIRIEKEGPSIFSTKGDLFDSLRNRQRLTHDYIRKTLTPKTTVNNQSLVSIIMRKQQILSQAKKAGVNINGRLQIDREARLITGDINIINLTWTVQYKITNARDYLFNSRDVQQNIKDVCRAVMSEVIGDKLFVDIMTVERYNIEVEMKKKAQAKLDQLNIGITIAQVIILDALPVDEVLFAYNEVNKAAQDMEKEIYSAEREFLDLIPESMGQALLIESKAHAYATELINQAEGNAGRFDALLVEYQKSPEITADRLYIEAIETLFQKTPNTIIDPKLQGILPVFLRGDMSKSIPQKVKSADPAEEFLKSHDRQTMSRVEQIASSAMVPAPLLPIP